MAEGINYIIGNSLVNELEDKKLARMLKPLKEKQADQTLNSTINEDDAIKAKTNLFQICADLRNEVLALSKQVKSLQVKVDELENESTVMKSALNSVSKFQLSPRLAK